MWKKVVRQVLGIAVLQVLGVALLGLALAHGEEKLFTRIAVADAKAPVVVVLNEDGKELGRFTVPSPATLYPVPGGQYVLTVHTGGNAVGFLWGGLRLEDHGDHSDVKEENPYVAATLRTGPKPVHAFVSREWVAVHHDGDGTVALFDLRRLGVEFTPRLIPTGGADHGAVAVLGEALLVGGMERGRLEAYTLGGQRVLAFPQACPGLHGEAVLGEWAAFGCADGVLLVRSQGRGLVAQKIPNPANAPQGARVGRLVAHPNQPFFVGNFGRGLAFIHPREGRMEPFPLPAPSWRSPYSIRFDPEGEALYVLTEDGKLHKIDPRAKRLVWSLEAVTPAKEGAPRVGMAVAHGVAYLTDPQKGEVVKVDLEEGKVKARFQVGGAPSGIALFQVEGVKH